jgi:hypothetical protein
MTRKYTLYLLAASTALCSLCGCYSGYQNRSHACFDQDGGSNDYAQRAYLQQQAENEYALANPRLDEVSFDENLIALRPDMCQDGEWERRPYETIEEWRERLQCQLCMNYDAIRTLEAEYQDLETNERQNAMAIRDLVLKNEHLRQQSIQAREEFAEANQGLINTAPPPFTVHFVQKEDTLVSIAREYYNDPDRVKDILLWNQGWIRHPDELVAGLGIVLFADNVKLTGEQAVYKYMQHLHANFKLIRTETVK